MQGSSSSTFNNCFRLVPLITPAVCPRHLWLDIRQLFVRSLITFVVSGTLLTIYQARSNISFAGKQPIRPILFGACSAFILTAIVWRADLWKADRALDEMIVDKFCSSKFITGMVGYHIGRSPRAARLLRERKQQDVNIDLNKRTPGGKYLVTEEMNIAVFRELIDAGFDLKAIAVGSSIFLRFVVSARDPAYLRYALERRAVHPSDFKDDEIVAMFVSVKSEAAVLLLIQHGFGVNTLSSGGSTAVDELATRNPQIRAVLEDHRIMTSAQLITILARYGGAQTVS